MLLSKCCGINVGVRYLDVVYLERERRNLRRTDFQGNTPSQSNVHFLI